MTLATEISYQDPCALFAKFTLKSWPIILHSSDCNITQRTSRNRYSYIVFDPIEQFILHNGAWHNQHGSECVGDPFQSLSQFFAANEYDVLDNLPPFQGGLVGFFSYDLCHYLENISLPKLNMTQLPELAVGLYDAVISFDHCLQKAWIVASGYPKKGKWQYKHARKRINEISQILKTFSVDSCELGLDIVDDVISNFKQQEYESIVEKAKQYILAGDIFEVNLSQCFSVKLKQPLNGFQLYRELCQKNPAPFSAYAKIGEHEIISASPERYLQVKDRLVEACPIKGTIRRGATPSEDQRFASQLRQSEKDRSENIMIVDLMRNDLSRVCQDHSVKVTQLCGLESFATVHHLASYIQGRLKPNKSVFDLLSAAFPGGSVTGAPKIRAMQIISELEPNRRNAYCGSIAWINFKCDMDSSIVIRTFLRHKNILTFQTGGAVVLDSDPSIEYEETLLKAKALLHTIKKCEMA